MIKRCPWIFITMGVLIGLVLLVTPAIAQNHWLRPVDETSVSVDIFKPKLKGDSDFNLFTTTMFFSAYVPATDKFAVVAEFPVANADTDEFNETLLGNPYFGVEYRMSNMDATRTFVGRLGLRPPIASDEKLAAGSIGEVTSFDRIEAFRPDLTTFSVGGGLRLTPYNALAVDADINGSLMMNSDTENDFFVDYSLTLWMAAARLRGGVGFTGRWLMTESDFSFGEASWHHIGALVNFDLGGVQPGVHFRIPIDDELSDVLTFTWGLSLTAEFE